MGCAPSEAMWESFWATRGKVLLGGTRDVGVLFGRHARMQHVEKQPAIEPVRKGLAAVRTDFASCFGGAATICAPVNTVVFSVRKVLRTGIVEAMSRLSKG